MTLDIALTLLIILAALVLFATIGFRFGNYSPDPDPIFQFYQAHAQQISSHLGRVTVKKGT